MINQQDWNTVRNALKKGETLYKRTSRTVTEFNEETGEETSRSVLSYEPVDLHALQTSFARIEADVERIVQEVEGYRIVERDLRAAMDVDSSPGAEVQRRG